MQAHLKDQSSFSNDAVLTTTYDDDYTVSGNGFLLQKNFTISAAGTLLLLFDYTTLTGTDKKIFIRPAIFSTTSGPVTVTAYRGTDYSGGTQLHAYNLNTIIGGESKITITQGPTGSVKGTEVQNWLVGTGSTNQSSGGGSIEVDVNFVRPNTGKTLMEIVNSSGEQITFNVVQKFFEL